VLICWRHFKLFLVIERSRRLSRMILVAEHFAWVVRALSVVSRLKRSQSGDKALKIPAIIILASLLLLLVTRSWSSRFVSA